MLDFHLQMSAMRCKYQTYSGHLGTIQRVAYHDGLPAGFGSQSLQDSARSNVDALRFAQQMDHFFDIYRKETFEVSRTVFNRHARVGSLKVKC